MLPICIPGIEDISCAGWPAGAFVVGVCIAGIDDMSCAGCPVGGLAVGICIPGMDDMLWVRACDLCAR